MDLIYRLDKESPTSRELPADARAPVELVFQQAVNDLFVVRLAGNVLSAEALGSLAYAAQTMTDSLRVVLVLGHSGCGAVTAAVDASLDAGCYPAGEFGPPLRALVDRVMRAVDDSAGGLARTHGAAIVEHPEYRSALIETAVAVNAGATARTLKQKLGDRVPHELAIAFGVYDLASHRVGVPGAAAGDGVALLDAPPDSRAIEELATAVAASPRVAALLQA